MKSLILSFILFGMVSVCACQTNGNKGTLTIRLTGFRNDKGQCCVSLFNAPQGFPGKYEKAYKTMRCRIKDHQANMEFSDLPNGTYAISVLHDENLNNKLETSFFGIPKEGCGASNNPGSLIGPPSFSDAKFELKSSSKTLEIVIKYFGSVGN